MEQNTSVDTRLLPDAAVISVRGEVTSFSEQILEQAYEDISKKGTKNICFNFQNVSYINSAGMAIFIGILTKSRKREQTLAACGLTEHFQKIFDMVGITKYMKHFASEEQALLAFKNQT